MKLGEITFGKGNSPEFLFVCGLSSRVDYSGAKRRLSLGGCPLFLGSAFLHMDERECGLWYNSAACGVPGTSLQSHKGGNSTRRGNLLCCSVYDVSAPSPFKKKGQALKPCGLHVLLFAAVLTEERTAEKPDDINTLEKKGSLKAEARKWCWWRLLLWPSKAARARTLKIEMGGQQQALVGKSPIWKTDKAVLNRPNCQ